MNKFLTQMWADIKEGKNVTVYLAVCASFIVFFMRFFDFGSEAWTGKLLLATVALLLIELLRLKTSSETLVSAITSFDPRSHIAALQGYPPRADMVKLFESKSTISILTITCSQIKHDYRIALTKHLEAGGELRIITVDSTKKVFENVVYFGELGNKVNAMVVNHRNAIESLTQSWDSYITNGKCQIGYVPHVPPYRLIFTKNKDGEKSAIWLPRPLAVTGAGFLGCRLDGSNHNEHLTYLEAQFEYLWVKASKFTPKQTPAKEILNEEQLKSPLTNISIAIPPEAKSLKRIGICERQFVMISGQLQIHLVYGITAYRCSDAY